MGECERGGRSEFSGTMEKLTPESEHRMAGRDDRLRHPMNCAD